MDGSNVFFQICELYFLSREMISPRSDKHIRKHHIFMETKKGSVCHIQDDDFRRAVSLCVTQSIQSQPASRFPRWSTASVCCSRRLPVRDHWRSHARGASSDTASDTGARPKNEGRWRSSRMTARRNVAGQRLWPCSNKKVSTIAYNLQRKKKILGSMGSLKLDSKLSRFEEIPITRLGIWIPCKVLGIGNKS